MVYRWKAGAHMRGDAQFVGEALEELRQRVGGRITPNDVVAVSADESAPLHSRFEWDDAVAAHSYRVEQAGALMRAVVVSVDRVGQKPLVVRAFVSIADEETKKPVYTSVADAMSDPVLREQVLRQAKAELRAWRERYQELQELSGIFSVIDQEVVAA